MAKAALNMMTKTSAEEFARSGIYMNSVDTGRGGPGAGRGVWGRRDRRICPRAAGRPAAEKLGVLPELQNPELGDAGAQAAQGFCFLPVLGVFVPRKRRKKRL